jgi:hypothetical protein
MANANPRFYMAVVGVEQHLWQTYNATPQQSFSDVFQQLKMIYANNYHFSPQPGSFFIGRYDPSQIRACSASTLSPQYDEHWLLWLTPIT